MKSHGSPDAYLATFSSLSLPTTRASTVVFPSLAAANASDWRNPDHWNYGLIATPTSRMLEEAWAEIEGARYTLLYPSGLCAISCALLALLQQGDECLIADQVYSPTREYANTLSRYGIRVRYVDTTQGAEAVAAAFSPETRLLWLESPGSVTLEVCDVPGIAAVAKAHGVVTLIDNTYAASVFFKPLAHGVDIVMQALTKYPSGGSDILLGSLSTNDENLFFKLKRDRLRLGIGVSADDCFLLYRSLPSLPLRLTAHSERGEALAAWFGQRPEVSAVLHPSRHDHIGHHYWQRDFSGGGGLLSIILDRRYTLADIDRMVIGLRWFSIGYSWGGAHGVVMAYEVASMRTVSPWPPPNFPDADGILVRWYVGLEGRFDELTEDLERGFKRLNAAT